MWKTGPSEKRLHNFVRSCICQKVLFALLIGVYVCATLPLAFGVLDRYEVEDWSCTMHVFELNMKEGLGYA